MSQSLCTSCYRLQTLHVSSMNPCTLCYCLKFDFYEMTDFTIILFCIHIVYFICLIRFIGFLSGLLGKIFEGILFSHSVSRCVLENQPKPNSFQCTE